MTAKYNGRCRRLSDVNSVYYELKCCVNWENIKTTVQEEVCVSTTFLNFVKKEGLAPRSPDGKVLYPNVAGETCDANEIHL